MFHTSSNASQQMILACFTILAPHYDSQGRGAGVRSRISFQGIFGILCNRWSLSATVVCYTASLLVTLTLIRLGRLWKDVMEMMIEVKGVDGDEEDDSFGEVRSNQNI